VPTYVRTQEIEHEVGPRGVVSIGATDADIAYALDQAADAPLGDEHVLVGMLSVPGSVAARVLARLGVSLEDVTAVLAPAPPRGL